MNPPVPQRPPLILNRLSALIAAGSVVGIALYMVLHYSGQESQPLWGVPVDLWPLIATLVLGGFRWLRGWR